MRIIINWGILLKPYISYCANTRSESNWEQTAYIGLHRLILLLQQCPLRRRYRIAALLRTHRPSGADWINSCCYVRMCCQWLADWMIFLSSQTTPQEWAGSFLSPPKIRIYIYFFYNLTGILFLIYKHFNIYLNARLDVLFIHIFNNLYRPIWNKRGWPRVFDATQPPQSSDEQPKCVQAMVLTPTTLQNTL